MTPPLRRQSLVAQVYDDVRDRIVAGAIACGTGVSIAETAKRLGVSATPVREALARLAAEGLLVFHENVGYRVPDLPTAQDYTDWAVARIVVESNALTYILGPVDPRLLDEADALNREIRATRFGGDVDGVRRFSELNWAFHSRLIALARNATLSELHARLYAAPQFARIFLGRGIPNKAHVVAEHDAIVQRLRRGDRAGAAAALRDHIVDSLERDARTAELSVSLKRLARGRPRA
ncbi:MAG TPA: GntR family transcriptional regulator [Casimicrobiaceae bacterium]|nr:GntR family transcriptional regulator [Casimicrobiaceae bacterium]